LENRRKRTDCRQALHRFSVGESSRTLFCRLGRCDSTRVRLGRLFQRLSQRLSRSKISPSDWLLETAFPQVSFTELLQSQSSRSLTNDTGLSCLPRLLIGTLARSARDDEHPPVASPLESIGFGL